MSGPIQSSPNNNAIRIRRANRSDLETIVSFNRAMAEETEGKTLDEAILTAGVAAGLADPDRSLYFIAEVDRRAVGQTMVTTEWSDWRNGYFWWIQSVYVEHAYRRRGVFRSLYEHISAGAQKTEGICGLRLYVHRENQRALQTYAHLGMSVTEYLLCEEVWPPP